MPDGEGHGEGHGQGRTVAAIDFKATAIILALLSIVRAPAAEAKEPGLRPGAGSPFAVRDAFPQSAGDLNLQGIVGYQRGRSGTEDVPVNPAVKYGVGRGLELRLGGTYTLGDGSSSSLGDVSTGVRWQAFDEKGWRPAIALLAQATMPSGPADRGVAAEFSVIASRTSGRGPGSWGVHLNAGWIARPSPGADERSAGYRFGAAVSHVVDPDTLLIAAYARETQDRDQADESIVEAGVERRLNADVSTAFALGTGLNHDSPAVRFRAGLSWTFSTGP